MLHRIDETIVAQSSAPGRAALGIVRLSGPSAIGIVDQMFQADEDRALGAPKGWTRHWGEVFVDADLTVPACIFLFRAPYSYTRQDVVEIHTIGSPPVLDLIRRNAIAYGAVPAEPGEFTARAFFGGAMDLARAEAVAAVIRAESDTQLRAARRMMDGTLARRIRSVRDELAELTALVEADIDFAQEPIEFITPPELGRRISRLAGQLEELLAGTRFAERFDALAQILLFGPPNAGKSTLMNRLSGMPRAICAAVAGTTRDVLSAPVRVGRGEAILLDTAGVDYGESRSDQDSWRHTAAPRRFDCETRHDSNSSDAAAFRRNHGSEPSPPSGFDQEDTDVAEMARAMTLATARHVDLLCVVVDLTRPPDARFAEMVRSLAVPMVVAGNKLDLLSAEAVSRAVARIETFPLGPVCAVSARTGEGVTELARLMADALGGVESTTLGESLLITERQGRAICDALDAMRRCSRLTEFANETIECADLAAFELREALDALGSVTGEVTTEDLLSQVFANFCIGK